MRIPRSLRIAGPGLSASLTSGLSGCSSDGGGGPSSSLTGNWDVTSFLVRGTDALADGLTFSMSLSGGTHTFDVTNDMIGICDQS